MTEINVFTNHLPLHAQLLEILEADIKSGSYKQGDLFATEKSLMERFSVSSTTVRRVLNDLVQKGYLFRRAGKGTFVRRPLFEAPLGPLSSFIEEMQSQGIMPSWDILSFRIRKDIDPIIYDKLQSTKRRGVYYLKKLMRADGLPIAIYESYWPHEYGEVLKKYDLKTTGIFFIAENALGITLGEAEGTIDAHMPTIEECNYLNIQNNIPLLVKKQVIYSTDGKPVNYVCFSYRGDSYKLKIHMISQSKKYLSNIEGIKFSSEKKQQYSIIKSDWMLK